jgi:hypothetical protein
MTIQETIEQAAKCLRLGAHPNIVFLALRSMDYTPERASLIVQWAQQKVEKEHE